MYSLLNHHRCIHHAAILEDVHRALDAAADEVEGAAEAVQEMKQQVLAPAERCACVCV